MNSFAKFLRAYCTHCRVTCQHCQAIQLPLLIETFISQSRFDSGEYKNCEQCQHPLIIVDLQDAEGMHVYVRRSGIGLCKFEHFVYSMEAPGPDLVGWTITNGSMVPFSTWANDGLHR